MLNSVVILNTLFLYLNSINTGKKKRYSLFFFFFFPLFFLFLCVCLKALMLVGTYTTKTTFPSPFLLNLYGDRCSEENENDLFSDSNRSLYSPLSHMSRLTTATLMFALSLYVEQVSPLLKKKTVI